MSNFAFDDATPSKRLEALQAFIEYWVAPRRPEYGATTEQLDQLQVPAPLRQLYAFCYNWPREDSLSNSIPLLSVQNYLKLRPSTHETDEHIPPGLVCFADENQGVTQWATLLEGDDPPVYGRDYEEDEMYQSPDGEIHHSWRKLHTPLTDFLIGYVLSELTLATGIWTLTPLVEHLEAHPQEMTPLVSWVLGYPRKVSLYNDDVLAVQVARWKQPDKWEFTARDDAALAKVSHFAGSLVSVGFEVVESAEGEQKPRKWHVGFYRNGSGSLSSARSPRYLSRDKMEEGAVSLDAIVAEVEAYGGGEVSAENLIKVGIRREEVSRMQSVRNSAEHWLPKPAIGRLFQQAVEAVAHPSPALLEQLQVGSPLDWVE